MPATSAPADITPGPDGNLWFTDQGTPRDDRANYPGRDDQRVHKGLNAGSLPNGIATGTDGNVWFADGGTTKRSETSTRPQKSSPSSRWPGRVRREGLGRDGREPLVQRPGDTKADRAVRPRRSRRVGHASSRYRLGGRRSRPELHRRHWADWAGTQPSIDAYGFDGYQWLLDGSPIAGATSAAYTPTGDQAGHQLSCVVTVTYTLLDVTASATSSTVTVKGAAEQLADLATAVTGVGPGSSLLDKVVKAQSYLAADDTASACATLADFISQVAGQTGKKITTAQADSFTAQARNIEALLGC